MLSQPIVITLLWILTSARKKHTRVAITQNAGTTKDLTPVSARLVILETGKNVQLTFSIIRCLLLKFKSLDISLTLKFFHIYFENLFQISMSVKQQHTIAVLMPFVITRRGPLTVHASLVTQEMDVTAQVGILVFYIFCMSSQTLLFSFLVFSFYVLQSLAAY